MTCAVYASLYTVRAEGPVMARMPVGFGDGDFKSACALMHRLDGQLAKYPDLVCEDQLVTVGTSATALTKATFDDQNWHIGGISFSPAAYRRMRHVERRAVELALAGNEQTVQIFFEKH